MPKADVLQLVSDLSSGQADTVLDDRLYREVLEDLGRDPRAWISQVSLVTVTKGTATYSPPSSTVRVLAVLYDDKQLYEANRRELEAINPQWRDESGVPRAFIRDQETLKDFRLYPAPDKSTKSFIPIFGEPLGREYAEYSAVVIHTEIIDDTPSWLDLPIALLMLQKEFSRESNHQDLKYSDICGRLATLFLGMVS